MIFEALSSDSTLDTFVAIFLSYEVVFWMRVSVTFYDVLLDYARIKLLFDDR